ncbi:MAG: YggT family protein [Bacillota bacterium]|nr:YggT family protein [Bacillota bacterium]
MSVSLYSIVRTVFNVYYILIFIRIILSWINTPDNAVTRFIYEVTEPVLGLFRRLIPPRPGFPLDLSPIFAYIVLQIIETLILRLIMTI